MEHTRIIISDLHVGVQDDFDIFASPGSEKHALFTAFLNHLRERAEPIELVINGDFVDFLQLRPWDDLSREAAFKKMSEIIEKSPDVFSSLGNFLSDPRHRIRILPGNHDVELAFPKVRQALREAILKSAPEAGDRLEIFGPPDSARTTYRPVINGITVQIEHGNEGDKFNSLNYTALFNDAETGTDEFSYPPGTKLVYDIMNEFKEKFRFVDVLKPEMPAVILILLALKPFMSALKVPAVSVKLLGAASNSIFSLLRRKISGMPLGAKVSDGSADSDADPLEQLFSRTIPDEGSPKLLELESFFSNDEILDDKSETLGLDFLKPRLWLLSWAMQALVRFQAGRQGEIDYTLDHKDDDAAKDARKRLVGDVKVVVFGHTHEALKTEFDEGLYVNSGTWADLVALPQDGRAAMLKWLDDVAVNKFERAIYPTYVKIAPTSGGIAVSLNLWADAGEKELWAKNI